MIRDNGRGMSRRQVETEYLRIAYNRQEKHGPTLIAKNRGGDAILGHSPDQHQIDLGEVTVQAAARGNWPGQARAAKILAPLGASMLGMRIYRLALAGAQSTRRTDV